MRSGYIWVNVVVVPAKSVSSMLPSLLMLSRRSISFCKIRISALATFCSCQEAAETRRQEGREDGSGEWWYEGMRAKEGGKEGRRKEDKNGWK
jgi:hypothetical protein